MPHSFTWAPGAELRHASLDPAPGAGYPSGIAVETLCDRQIVTDTDWLAWLRPTCPTCDERTRKLVGAPTVGELAAKAVQS